MPDEELDTASADAPLSPQDEAALAEDVDLDPDTRRRILTLGRDLERLDYYALLGVDRGADRKALKRAYYDLAAKFHPDRYFRKKLGSYKPKMEAIFGRITLAHDTLTDRDKRAEYDAYLGEQRRSRAIEDLLADALAEVKRAEEKAAREASVEPAQSSQSSRPSPQSPPAAARPGPAPHVAAPVVAVSLDARREALARRLLGGRAVGSQRPAAPSSAPASASSAPSPAPPAPPPAPSPEEAMQALRRRYEERVAHAKAAQARKYIANADTAMAAGDVITAANNLRVAVSLTPEDKDLAARAAEAQSRADALLAETYTKQAQYEEKNGQWPEASRSWARVCKVRPKDGHAHERAAHAIVKGEGDLHEAARLAQHACALDPENARYRVTLAAVYTAAGLARNARRELETAAQLAPHDGTIQAMLKSAGKPT